MLLQHIKIDKNKVIEMKQQCFDYSSKDNSRNLRERHILLGLPDHEGLVCVEGNTNGWHIAGTQARLQQAISWLNDC